MTTEWWRAVTAPLLYSAQFERLDDDLVDRRTRALLEEPVVDLAPEDEYRAITEALASSARVTEAIPEPHGEAEFRGFLRRLLARMDEMRPWQTPPHRPLSQSRWAEYRDAQVVGRIRMRYVDAQSRMKYVLRGMQEGNLKIRVLILRLRSGDEVALAAPWWPESQDVAVLTRDHKRRAEDVVAALVDGTGLIPDEVMALPEDNAAPLGAKYY